MDVQIFKNRNAAIFCETYNCRNRAAWFIGRPDGPRSIWSNLCQECVENMIRTMPEELKKNFVPQKGYLLIEKEELDTLLINQKEPEEPEESKQEEEAVCQVCGKVCKSQFGLDAHMRSHKGE